MLEDDDYDPGAEDAAEEGRQERHAERLRLRRASMDPRNPDYPHEDDDADTE